MMEPPSYEEASLQPPAASTQGLNTHPCPATPPPSYGEAVTVPPDPFPVLTPPTVPTAVTSPPQNAGITTHPLTQIGVMPPVNSRQTQSAVQVVMTQPPPVVVSVACLTNIPGLVRCPRCHQVVTTKVNHSPGSTAWCLCVLLSLMGLICGFCLIPLMVRGLQDAHHYCPQCGTHLHVYRR